MYCPRPSSLDTITEQKLTHLRNHYLNNDTFNFPFISFDQALNLELYQQLDISNSTLAAGLFISSIEDMPKTLREVHASMLKMCYPLSWFFVAHLSNYGQLTNRIHRGREALLNSRLSPKHNQEMKGEEWAHGIVLGNTTAISRLLEQIEGLPT